MAAGPKMLMRNLQEDVWRVVAGSEGCTVEWLIGRYEHALGYAKGMDLLANELEDKVHAGNLSAWDIGTTDAWELLGNTLKALKAHAKEFHPDGRALWDRANAGEPAACLLEALISAAKVLYSASPDGSYEDIMRACYGPKDEEIDQLVADSDQDEALIGGFR